MAINIAFSSAEERWPKLWMVAPTPSPPWCPAWRNVLPIRLIAAPWLSTWPSRLPKSVCRNPGWPHQRPHLRGVRRGERLTDTLDSRTMAIDMAFSSAEERLAETLDGRTSALTSVVSGVEERLPIRSTAAPWLSTWPSLLPKSVLPKPLWPHQRPYLVVSGVEERLADTLDSRTMAIDMAFSSAEENVWPEIFGWPDGCPHLGGVRRGRTSGRHSTAAPSPSTWRSRRPKSALLLLSMAALRA